MRRDEAVFDRAGLAFIGVADDVFTGSRSLRTRSHFTLVKRLRPCHEASEALS